MATGAGTAPWAVQVERFAEARAPELQSLFAAIKATAASGQSGGNISSNPGDDDQEKGGVASFVEIPGHLRRRTRSHNRRKYLFWTRKKSQKRAAVKKKQLSEKTSTDGEEGETKETKKRELKVAFLSRRVRRRIEFQELTQGNVGCSRDGAQRLVTHVWHTKRFYMAKMWGYWLPKGLSGRGRGAKAVLRWSKNGAVIHDASYYIPIQLEGLPDDLSIILSGVLEPLPGNAKDDSQFMGACYSNVMIHRFGKVPFSPISPAMVIFRSASASSPSEDNAQQRLWIWVHAAAFDEAFNSLQAACDGTGNGTVRCQSRKGELARLEVLGKKSFQVLEKLLMPRTVNASAAHLLQRILTQAEVLPPRAIVPVEVHDPRYFPIIKKSLQLHTLPMDISKDDRHEDGDATMNVEHSKSTTSQPDEHSVSYWRRIMHQSSSCQLNGSSVLWESPLIVEPPLSEKSMNRKQHNYRLSHYRLGVEQNDPSDCKACPILLLNHDKKRYFGWSIIVPVNWVHAFWMPLVHAGARVVGQSERRWLMTDAGLPSFPFDFPDCQAYENYITRELQEQFQVDNRRPPGKRLSHSLPSPPWKSIPELIERQESACQHRTWDGRESPLKGSSIEHEPAQTSQHILMKVAIEQGQADLPIDVKDKGGFSFPGCVARSRVVLSRYLHDCSLPGFSGAIGAGEPADIKAKTDLALQHVQVQTAKEGTPCYLRILVRAARKGVVEEASVLYAPKMEDFHTWLCRSQSWQGVEVPVAKDARDDTSSKAGSMRDAIGFVTSAAPWQSKDAAIAFGSTRELSKLWFWQLADGRWDSRKEIFLLFHNPRSTKLRPALASIVLETGFVDDAM